jgi:hypothetical protein
MLARLPASPGRSTSDADGPKPPASSWSGSPSDLTRRSSSSPGLARPAGAAAMSCRRWRCGGLVLRRPERARCRRTQRRTGWVGIGLHRVAASMFSRRRLIARSGRALRLPSRSWYVDVTERPRTRLGLLLLPSRGRGLCHCRRHNIGKAHLAAALAVRRGADMAVPHLSAPNRSVCVIGSLSGR